MLTIVSVPHSLCYCWQQRCYLVSHGLLLTRLCQEMNAPGEERSLLALENWNMSATYKLFPNILVCACVYINVVSWEFDLPVSQLRSSLIINNNNNTQKAALAKLPLTTHPHERAEPHTLQTQFTPVCTTWPSPLPCETSL